MDGDICCLFRLGFLVLFWGFDRFELPLTTGLGVTVRTLVPLRAFDWRWTGGLLPLFRLRPGLEEPFLEFNRTFGWRGGWRPVTKRTLPLGRTI